MLLRRIRLDKLNYYSGKLPVYSAVYGATEALIGLAVNVNEATYVITPRSAYYEFIPIEESDSPKPSTLELKDLRVGEMYEIVVTNFSGFYRYRLEDVVKVVGYYHQSPILEFMKEAVGHYHFYVEIASSDIKTFQTNLEHYLEEMNPRYRAGIEGNRIISLKMDKVQPGTFAKLHQELLQRGASLNQVKIPRLVKDAQLIALLEDNRVAIKN